MRRAVAILGAVLAIGVGCALTQQTRQVGHSGFLRDYSALSPGSSGEVLQIYIDLDADFAGYKQVMIDPVTVWLEGDSGLAGLPPDEPPTVR